MAEPYEIICNVITNLSTTNCNINQNQSNEIEQQLAKLHLNKHSVLKAANAIGISLQITRENADNIEKFSDLLTNVFSEYVLSISIYLNILRVAAHKSTIYKKLLDIYNYDLNTIHNFNFIDNLKAQFVPIGGYQSIYSYVSYLYIAQLLERLGRFWDARNAIHIAMNFRSDPLNLRRYAIHANIELDFIAYVNSMPAVKPEHALQVDNKNPLLVLGSFFIGYKNERYFRDICSVFFSKNNISELGNTWNPVVVVFCTLFDKMNFELTDIYKLITSHFTLKIIVIPDRVISKYPDPSTLGIHILPQQENLLTSLMQTCLLIIAKNANASFINLQSATISQLNSIQTLSIRRLSFKELEIAQSINHSSDAAIQYANLNLEKLTQTWQINGNIQHVSKKLIPTRLGTQIDEIRVIYSLAVWGKSYIANFLNICLPSMLSNGNLADLSNNSRSLFLLYTQEEDVTIFEENKQFQRLQKIISVEIVLMPPPGITDKYTVLSRTQSDTVQRSRHFDAICFLYSDFCWGQGAIKFSLQKLAEGYDGVVSTVPPVVLEDFYTILENYQDDFIEPINDGDCAFNISISPRKLVHHAKKIMHPIMRDNNLDYKINTCNPAYVLWLGPNDDLLIRCFHTHPVMLKVKHHTPDYWVPFEKSLDEWFLPRAFETTDRLYFIKDSDELTIISLTQEDFHIHYADMNFQHGMNHHLDSMYIARWAEANAAPMHKVAFNYYTIWHEYEINHESWVPVIERSEVTAQEVRLLVTLPDIVQHSENIELYKARVKREKRLAGNQLELSINQSFNNALNYRSAKIHFFKKMQFQSILSKIIRFYIKLLRAAVRKAPLKIKQPTLVFLKKIIAMNPKLFAKVVIAYQGQR